MDTKMLYMCEVCAYAANQMRDGRDKGGPDKYNLNEKEEWSKPTILQWGGSNGRTGNTTILVTHMNPF